MCVPEGAHVEVRNISSEISSVSVVDLCSSDEDEDNEAPPKKAPASASANDPSPQKNPPHESNGFQRNALIASEISSVSVVDLCSSDEDEDEDKDETQTGKRQRTPTKKICNK